MNLTNQTILITGGTSGIGYHLAVRLHENNNKVIICGRRKDRLSEISSAHPGIDTYVCDMEDADQRVMLAEWAINTHPSLNVLVNNAGILHYVDLTKPVDQQQLTAEVTTNLIAPIHLSGLMIAHLQKQENPAIMNVTSGLAFTPIANMPVYCATKAGMHAFTMSLRHQLKNTSIKVFEIIPPAVKTNLGKSDGNDDTGHDAMDVKEFVEQVLLVAEQDQYQKGIGIAEGLVAQRDALFDVINH
ncbi:SDR family oxidoreductase [Chitinophaga filiformis]|uniref:SDR family NAD(P)-dependent oxidoreductase n=1 Tax=Chitinophaga filiformis TaxID=104663 RepID=A0ABY4HXH2_CHIFI|nr:SDR family NAD(P)-dependent oxidoreductase [Chitinophaga filiformis]UPK68497.1 SDR family NAD(P)-dependent oxidoreductase [Chitinophaga filiformis]